MVASHFVGREQELGYLKGALDEAVSGQASLVLVGGDAGVGKSGLVAEFSRRCRQRGVRVLVGGCVPLGEAGLPYSPVIEVLRTVVRGENLDALRRSAAVAVQELARLVPELGAAGPRSPGSTQATSSSELRIFEPMRDLLERLAEDAPTVLVLEDLHWAGQSTRDLLAYLARHLGRGRLLLVGTYRSDGLDRGHPLRLLLAELRRMDGVDEIGLGPFDRPVVAQQLEALLGESPSWELLESVWRRSAGNPFFTEQLVAAHRHGDTSTLPDTLRDILLVGIESLSADLQRILRVAAGAGQRVHHRLLSSVSGLSNVELTELLREAVGRRILVPIPAGGEYAFRHVLLVEAVYSTLLPGEREHLHGVLAALLSTQPELAGESPSAAEIAHHWHVAGDRPRALAASVEAGRVAEQQYAFAEARHHFERALELWDSMPVAGLEDLTATDVLQRAAEMAYRSGDFRGAEGLVRRAITSIDAEQDRVVAGRLYERLGRYLWVVGRGEAAIAAYERAVALIPSDPPSAGRARVLAALGQGLMLEFRSAEAQAHCEEAIAVARAVGSRAEEGQALNTLGVVAAHSGRFDQALDALWAARRIADELDLIDDRLRACMNLSSVLTTAGRTGEAARTALEGVEMAQDLGVERGWSTALVSNALDAYLADGRWAEARDLARLVVLPATRSASVGWMRVHRAFLACASGDDATARRELARARACGVATHEHSIVPFRNATAEIALWAGRLDDAADAVAGAAERVPHGPADQGTPRLYALALWAQADRALAARERRDQDTTDQARRQGEAVLARVLEVSARWSSDGGITMVVAAWLAHAEAEADRLDGRADHHAWQHAVTAWDTAGMPYPRAVARWRLAQALLAGGTQRDDAARALRTAHATATALDMVPLRERIEETGRRGRLPLPVQTRPFPTDHAAGRERQPATDSQGASPGGGLTPRQLEVLRLLAAGNTNRAIADQLVISEHTVARHVENIYAKLDVSSRAAATAFAHTHGLV